MLCVENVRRGKRRNELSRRLAIAEKKRRGAPERPSVSGRHVVLCLVMLMG